MSNFCTKCGAPVNEGMKFCVSCGNPLGQLPEQPAPPTPPPAVLDSQLSSPPPVPVPVPAPPSPETPNSTLQTPNSFAAPAAHPPAHPNSQFSTLNSQLAAPAAPPPESVAKKKSKLPLILVISGVIVVGIIIAVILVFFIFSNNANEPNQTNTPGLPLPTAADMLPEATSPAPVPSATEPSPDNTADLPSPSGIIEPPESTEPPAPDFDPAETYASVIDSVGGLTGDYAFYDIDGNGIDELIMRYEVLYDEYTYIYTYVDGVAYKIGEYWSRNSLAAIDDEGIIYSDGSNSAASSTIEAQRISDSKTSLVTVERWDADYDENVFSHTVDGRETEISEVEFYNALKAIYNNDGILSDLSWLPLPSGSGINISTDNWIDVNGKIRIPPTWDYDVFVDDDDNEWQFISGEGIGGHLNMLVGYIIDAPLETVLEESLSYKEFQFDNGFVGYMIENADSIAWVFADSWWEGLLLYHEGDMSLFTDNEAIILAVAATLTYGQTEVAYVKIDENSTSSFLDFIQLPLLIDDVVWVNWNDFELQEKYGLTDDDMDNDYALVNEIEEWVSYFATENTTFILANYEDLASVPVEVSLEEFRAYALDRQQSGGSVLAEVLISPTGEVLKVEELYTP